MKALTVMQPWAQLLILGATRYDIRSWKTSYRGPLLIHSAKRITERARQLCDMKPMRALLAEAGIPFPSSLPRGVFLGTITLEDCLATDQLLLKSADERERALAKFRPGHWAWKMSAPRRLDRLVPYKGALGVFEVPDEAMHGIHHLTP